jgi:hypothetical protein
VVARGRPPPASYTIGITVSGLTGNELALQDNGGDNLPITANGSYTFATHIAGGGTYNITVLTQPSNPSQLCVVPHASGTANADVTGIEVACTFTQKVLYSFGTFPDGYTPSAELVLDGSGNLYGTTVEGGLGGGTVFKLTQSNGQWAETIIYSFCQQNSCADGGFPYSTLIFDTAGNLYGTTEQGGAYGSNSPPLEGDGVVFELTPQPTGPWTETVLHSFGNGTDGIAPLAGLVFDKSGNLYGTTAAGGTGGGGGNCSASCGTVFELSPAAGGQWTENVLYNFCSQAACADGIEPMSALIIDTAGNLYGTTFEGGDTGNDGTAFELTPGENSQWTWKLLYTFHESLTNGGSPSGLIMDKSGNLYGTTEFGANGNNGVAFELSPGSGGQWTENVLYLFCSQANCLDGGASRSPLVFDNAGNLYGTTILGGTSQFGVVFGLTPARTGTWTEVPIYNFLGGEEGSDPVAGLILDANGNLYGVAPGGPGPELGIVFEVSP